MWSTTWQLCCENNPTDLEKRFQLKFVQMYHEPIIISITYFFATLAKLDTILELPTNCIDLKLGALDSHLNSTFLVFLKFILNK